MIGAGLPLTADAARSPTVARPLPSDHAQLRAARARWRGATRRMRERTVQRRTPSPSAGSARAGATAARSEPHRHRQSLPACGGDLLPAAPWGHTA